MFVRLKQDFNKWIYNGKKGNLLDVPDEYGNELIKRGIAASEDTERAINTLAGVEQRDDKQAKKK